MTKKKTKKQAAKSGSSSSNKRPKKTIYTWSNPAPPVRIQFSGTGAKQSFKDECDINNILKRFTKTGAIEHLNKHQPRYGVISGENFLDAQNTIAQAKSMFNELPAATRRAFDNEPERFLDFVSDEANHPKLHELGLTHSPYRAPEKEAPQEPLKSDEVTNSDA